MYLNLATQRTVEIRNCAFCLSLLLHKIYCIKTLWACSLESQYYLLYTLYKKQALNNRHGWHLAIYFPLCFCSLLFEYFFLMLPNSFLVWLVMLFCINWCWGLRLSLTISEVAWSVFYTVKFHSVVLLCWWPLFLLWMLLWGSLRGKAAKDTVGCHPAQQVSRQGSRVLLKLGCCLF